MIMAIAPAADYANSGLIGISLHYADRRITSFLRSLDQGTSWEDWVNLSNAFPRVTLMVSGDKGIDSWASVGPGVMQPVYKGWKGWPITEGRPTVLRLLKLASGRLLAATTEGIFVSANGSYWEPCNEGLPESSEPMDVEAFAPAGEDRSLWALLPGGLISRRSML